MAEQFGLNDALAEQFGLDDATVGQSAVTKPVIAPGQQAVAQAAKTNQASPYTPKYPESTISPSLEYSPGTQQYNTTQNYSPEELQAAKQGVNVDQGAPLGIQALTSFPDTAPEKQAALASLMGGTDKVRMGPQSKQLEFLDPKTQKWTTLLGSRVMSAITNPGGAMEFSGQLAGSLGGAAAGGSLGGPPGAVGGSIGGAGLGGAVGRYARVKTGQALGVINKDYPVGSDVGMSGVKSAAFDAGGQAVLGGLRIARYWFKGARAFSPAEATALGDEAAKADKLVNEIAETSGMPFTPTVGQKVNASMGGTKLGQKALGYDSALSKDNSPVVPQMSALHRANEDALVGYLDAVNEPMVKQVVDQGRQLALSKTQAGRNVSDALTSIYNDTLDSTRQLVSQLPDSLPASEKGKIMQTALAQADKQAKTTIEDPAWAKYRDGTGYNPATFSSDIRVPWNDSVRNLMAAWNTRSRDAIIGAIQRDNSGLKLLFKEEPGTASKLIGTDGLPLKTTDAKAIPDVDLATLDDTIKWLRSDARQQLKNQQGVTYNEKDLVDLESTLSGMRNDYLKNSKPEIYSLLQDAESATRSRAAAFKQSAVADLLIKDGPNSYRLGPADALYKIIQTRDDTAAQQFAQLTKGYPEAGDAARQFLYAMYRKAVVDPQTLTPSAKLHTQFMSDYGNVIKQFFNPEDYATLNRIGGMGTVLAEQKQTISLVLPRVKQMLGGELADINAANLATKTIGGKYGPEQIGSAVALLKKLPDGKELVEQWQSATLQGLSQQLVKNGEINLTQLAKVLNGPQRDVITKLLDAGPIPRGRSYFDSLEVLQDATNMIRAQGKGQLENQTSGLVAKLARLIVGQFGVEARTVTFGQGVRTRAVPGQIYNAITDPKELDKLAGQAEKLMGKIKLANYSSAVLPYLLDSNY